MNIRDIPLFLPNLQSTAKDSFFKKTRFSKLSGLAKPMHKNTTSIVERKILTRFFFFLGNQASIPIKKMYSYNHEISFNILGR